MFDSDLEREGVSNIRRRTFLTSAAAALGGAVLWSWKKPRILQAAAMKPPGAVTIVQFSDSGQRLKTVRMTQVVKSDDEWRKQLGPGVFDITRNADTEIAFSGKYWNLHDKGIYRCICCDNALFNSDTKFESGTGWPSFWAPIAAENVRERSAIQHLESSGPLCPAPSAPRIWDTCSTMVRSPPIFAIA
jgi:peptide-methionine (R)-S-oxide reductase